MAKLVDTISGLVKYICSKHPTASVDKQKGTGEYYCRICKEVLTPLSMFDARNLQ